MYNIPCTSDMLKSSHIPLALNISPFAKLQQEEVSLGVRIGRGKNVDSD